MNPNEATRSHVYLHNSIFVSRAVDAGVETFKMSQGDRAAKKAASRDAQCMSFLHRMDVANLYTLATVLVDFLGTRYVCQSIVPGILQGEKTHKLMYGAVEASAPLSWEPEMHNLLEKYVGKHAMCATRVQPTQPLTDDRLKEVEALRTEPPLERADTRDEPTTRVCGPIEGKGIKGSDQRCYVLDLTRLTPRDANWVPKSMGGTGKWEEEMNGKSDGIPSSLEDDEWITAVLRQELVTQLTHQKMTMYLKTKEAAEKKEIEEEKAAEDGENTAKDAEKSVVEKKEDPAEKLPKKKELTPEDEAYLASLRFNVNVFLPQLRSLKGIDDDAVTQLEVDEEQARKAALHLWDVILPKMNLEMKEGSGHQLPLDGKSMVEFLHQRGINCRYMGRLATLAVQEEARDRQALEDVHAGRTKTIGRKVIPLSWLELLEVEMIARASKHVLDSYLNEEGGQTTQIIASFLSALVSDGEETAGESEKRIAKSTTRKGFTPDDDDFASLTLHGSAQIRGRKQVWDDIAAEIGRRFRYKLVLYNCCKSSGRAAYPTLLRRVCQRTGVRLVAKKYDLGVKCVCASKGRLTNSYPISPLDIFDVVPLMKHAGALSGEGFMPCSTGAGLPSLHIMLPDAKATFEAAHFSYSNRALPQALELAQEAAALYQRVVDGPLHLQIARCLDLTAAILFEAGETSLAAANASRSLGLSIQLGGFDSAEAMAGHSTLSHILLSSQEVDAGIPHLKAAAYLMELMAGPRYVELANCYYKIGSYYQDKNTKLALDYFKLAQSKPHSDRLAGGMMAKGTAMLYAKLDQYRPAVDAEKRAYQLYAMLLGEGHELTLNSQKSLLKYTKNAVEQGNKKVEEDKLRKEEEAADAMASMIQDEDDKEKKKKKGKGKKKK
jgi:protein TIF31